jgi:hypothetical protein
MKKRFVIATLIMLGLGMFSAGCGHNIHAHGWGIATPYFSAGNGTVDIVKDNVEAVVTEKTTADGVETIDSFKVLDQTTGYEVELAK